MTQCTIDENQSLRQGPKYAVYNVRVYRAHGAGYKEGGVGGEAKGNA